MSKNLYMHLLDGKPAKFDKEEGFIHFVLNNSRYSFSEMFVGSLETIKRQQEIDQKWRHENGLLSEPGFVYDYMRVKDDRDE